MLPLKEPMKDGRKTTNYLIHNRVLGQGYFEVLNIAKKLNLPPPFKIEIPQIKIVKKGETSKNNNSGPEVA